MASTRQVPTDLQSLMNNPENVNFSLLGFPFVTKLSFDCELHELLMLQCRSPRGNVSFYFVEHVPFKETLSGKRWLMGLSEKGFPAQEPMDSLPGK